MSEIKELTCIVCPRGCSLRIDLSTEAVSGNQCKRGEVYARNETKNPTRVLTTTVRFADDETKALPVRTATPIPKPLLFDAMKEINRLKVRRPIRMGDVLIPNLLQTGVSVVASKSVE